MHKRIDLTQTGGIPFNQTLLNQLQSSYSEAMQTLTQSLGDNLIISGCLIQGLEINEGWIVTDGELLPFKGGAVSSYFEVVEIKEALTFQNGVSKEVVFSRYAQCAASGTPFELLKRLNTQLETQEQEVRNTKEIDALALALQTLSADFVLFKKSLGIQERIIERFFISRNNIVHSYSAEGSIFDRISYFAPQSYLLYFKEDVTALNCRVHVEPTNGFANVLEERLFPGQQFHLVTSELNAAFWVTIYLKV